VLDFGIAKLRDEGRATQAAMTQAGDMLGTPQYMAPEQIRAEKIDGRADIYALGCMLYEMVTGRLPFEGPTLMSLLSKHLMENPPLPSQRRPELGIPPVIDELIMTAMSKDPNLRPPTMEAFADRVNALLATMPQTSNQMSAQQSAVHGVPNVPPTIGVGPPPGVATPHGAQMYPGGFGPQTPPPMHYPTPGVQPTPMPPMGPPGYGTPQAVYSPYAQPPPQMMTAPHPAAGGGGGMMKMMIIIIAVLVAGGAAAAVIVLTKKSDDTVVVPDDKKPVVDDKDKKPVVDDKDKKPVVDDTTKKPDKDDTTKKPEKDDTDKKPPKTDDDDDDDTKPTKDPKDNWGGAKDPKNGVSDSVAKMEGFRNAVCACNDAACVTKVTKDMQTWSLDLAKHGMDMANMDATAIKRMGDLGTEFAACATKAAQRVTPRPPPRPADINVTLAGFASRACACKDATCARTVMRSLVAYAKNVTADEKLKIDQTKAHATGEKLGRCLILAGMPQDELIEQLKQLNGL
jgi:hypothetical protein